MQESPSPLRRSYWCFISYKHTDNQAEGRQWATWLHQQLETYEVPEDLVGKKNQGGNEIPSRIFPVFRDEEELGAGSDLTDRIYQALDNSRVLVVLCSPRVIESPYVYEEIRHFKRIGKADEIYAAVIDGEPGSRVIEAGKCFPDTLQYEVDAEGNVHTDRSDEPLAADFRLPDGAQGWTSPEAYRQAIEDSDLKLSRKSVDSSVAAYQQRLELAKLKLISGILKVPLGVLQKRDKAYQLKLAQIKARRLRRWLAAVVLLALFAIAGGVLTWIERGRTQRSFSNNLLNQGSELFEQNSLDEGIATLAGSLQLWNGNRMAGDRLVVELSRRKILFPQRRLPLPPSGTFAFPPQDVGSIMEHRNNEDRRHPFARFSNDFDGVEFFVPLSGEDLSTETYTCGFDPMPTWEFGGELDAPPPDGYSIGTLRLVSQEEYETGGMLNALLKGRNPDGSLVELPIDVSEWSNGEHDYMTGLGLAASSTDEKWLAVLGFLIDDQGAPGDPSQWKSLREEPSLHLVDIETGKLRGTKGLTDFGELFQKAFEGHDLHAVRFVNSYFVVHFSSFERPGWRTEIFDCSNPNEIVHVVQNQLLPGLIDDFNLRTGEFLIRAPDGLITFRLVDGPSLEANVGDQQFPPAVQGAVPEYTDLGVETFPLLYSQDGRWAAEASRAGVVHIFDQSNQGELVRTFSLQLDPTVEGGLKLDRMLFLPHSPYLIFGIGVVSDASYMWSGWDFVRGEEIFVSASVRGDTYFSLVGASADGRHLLFEDPTFSGNEVPPRRALVMPTTGAASASALTALAELASGVQWTEQGLQALDIEGYFQRRMQLQLGGAPDSPEVSRWLARSPEEAGIR